MPSTARLRGIGPPANPQSARSTANRAKLWPLGRIEPQSEIFNLSAGTATPDRLEQLFVARGDLVKKDQVLGYLGGYAEQAAQQEMFKAQLEEAKLGSLSCR
jgi:hypothetical protein